MKLSRSATGFLVGSLLTAPLMAVSYFGEALAGLVFAPFALFDWLARALPGNVITLGIDAIVNAISSLRLGETSSTAKTIEQLLALVIFLVLGAAAGAVYFWLAGRSELASRRFMDLAFGAVSGVLVLLAASVVGFPESSSMLANVIWTLGLFVLWGGVLGWVHRKLDAAGATSEAGMAEDRVATAAAAPPVSSTVLNRRQFLVRVGNASAVVTVAGAGLGAFLSADRLEPVTATAPTLAPTPTPQATLQAAPSVVSDGLVPAPGTRLEYTPLAEHYRIDINLRSPEINGEGWRLPVAGLVDNPLSLTIDDLRQNYEARHEYVTMACISNPVGGDLIGTTYWTGVSLQEVLADAGLQEDAAYLIIRGADGFHETIALDLIRQDERIMLCYAWDNQPLTVDHGFPLRIWIPDLYGMKQPKWITSIEVTDKYEEGYWVRRGWDEVARMNTTSVVDTVATNAIFDDDSTLLVPIGGIAHAGVRGINRVEVRVDDGEWVEAALRTPLSEATWVIWRYDWPFEEGDHTFYVRATDGLDSVQTQQVRGARPSGATGIHSLRANLTVPDDADSAG